MGTYLRCLQMPEEFIRQQAVGERDFPSKNVIALHPEWVFFQRLTSLKTSRELYRFDTNTAFQTNQGEKQVEVTRVDPNRDSGLIITRTLSTPGGHEMYMAEVRELVDNGMAHTQVITFHNINTDETSVTRRTWNRV